MRGLVRDCVVELFARKTVYLFLAVTLVAVLLGLATGKASFEFHVEGNMDVDGVADFLRNPVTHVMNTFLSFLVFLAVLATAGLVPGMLARGRAEFYLSKPVSRTTLLLNKLFAVWGVYSFLILISGAVLYAVLVTIHGRFDWDVLYLPALNLVSFFIWLSITTVAGVLTGSTAVSIMCAFLVWVAQLILSFHDQIRALVGSQVIGVIVDVLYYIFPKTGQLGDITRGLAMGRPVDDWMVLCSSVAFAGAMLVVAVLVFNKKDY